MKHIVVSGVAKVAGVNFLNSFFIIVIVQKHKVASFIVGKICICEFIHENSTQLKRSFRCCLFPRPPVKCPILDNQLVFKITC